MSHFTVWINPVHILFCSAQRWLEMKTLEGYLTDQHVKETVSSVRKIEHNVNSSSMLCASLCKDRALDVFSPPLSSHSPWEIKPLLQSGINFPLIQKRRLEVTRRLQRQMTCSWWQIPLKEVNEVNSKNLEDYWLQQEQIHSLSWTSTSTHFRRGNVQVKKFSPYFFHLDDNTPWKWRPMKWS